MRKTWILVAAVLLVVGAAVFLYFAGDAADPLARDDEIAGTAGQEAAGEARFPPQFPDVRTRLDGKTISVELCGHGRIEVGPDRGLYPPAVEEAAQRLLARVADALAANADAGARAAAIFVEAMQQGGAQELRKAADDLAATIDMRDGRAYAMAWYLCGKAYPPRERTGPCALVTAARWAQIEPDNVMPWLFETNRAAAGGDPVALETAMTGAAAATASRLHWKEIFALAGNPLLAKADRGVELVALTRLVGIRAALPLPSLEAVQQQCRAEELLLDGRRQQCQAIASALTRGSTLLELGMAARLGQSAGWPSEKVSALRDKAEAIHALEVSKGPVGDYFSCAFLEAMKEHLTAVARLGEVGAGEAAIERSGKSAAALAAEFRAAPAANARR